MKYSLLHDTAVTKQWTAKYPYIANAVFRIVHSHGGKSYFRRFLESPPPGSAPEPRFSAIIVRYHTKVVIYCRPRKWLFLLVGLCDLSGNQHSLKALHIICSIYSNVSRGL